MPAPVLLVRQRVLRVVRILWVFRVLRVLTVHDHSPAESVTFRLYPTGGVVSKQTGEVVWWGSAPSTW